MSLRLLNLSTLEIAAGLTDGTLDFGLLRADAVPRGLRSEAVGRMNCALFVPRRLASATEAGVLGAKSLRSLPLVTLEGHGSFRRALERLARRARATPNVCL